MKNIAKIFVLIITVALVFGMLTTFAFAAEPADNGQKTTTVYLVPNALWAADNSRFAVYYEGSNEEEIWFDMQEVLGADGMYFALIPEEYTTFFFYSMNPDIKENDLDTPNLVRFSSKAATLPDNGATLYTLTEGKGDRATGTWSSYTPAAKIGTRCFGTLQAAVDVAAQTSGSVTIDLVQDLAENVTIPRTPTLDLTLEGNGYTFNGAITVDGKSAQYKTGSLTIKNVKFDATGITKDASINLGGNNAIRYATNVTVEKCTFTGADQAKVAIKSYTGGDKNISVVGCTVDNTMHSAVQLKNAEDVLVDGCTINSKNGINLNDTKVAVITNSTISVSGYALRAGQGSTGAAAPVITLTENTIHTNGTEGDSAIVIRGTASKAELTMTDNAVTTEGGVPHFTVSEMADSSNVAISANANYWGAELTAPTYTGIKVNVTNSYTDAECDNLVHGGNIIAYIGDVCYFSIEDALEAASKTAGNVTITLWADLTSNVTIVRAGDLDLTLDGNNHTINGAIIIDGKSATLKTGSLTIKNVKFDATGIDKDASINFGGNNDMRYVTNVTVTNCTFTGDANDRKVAIKSYTGGDKNITVANCVVDNTMHSILQVSGVDGVKIDNCVVNSKNGINLGSSKNVAITNSTVDVSGYAVRAGAGSGGDSGAITITNNTLKSANEDGDATIIIRGAATTLVDLEMTENIVVGDTHIAGTVADTKITAELNYWSGTTGSPVVNGTEFVIYEVYTTEAKNEFAATNLHGSGTAADPYVIKNIEDLRFFRDSVNAGTTYAGKYVVLTADVDLAGEEWAPIGNSSNAFKGIFDGANHTVSNLVITGYKSDVGFFGFTTDGEIKNLTINNAQVSGRLNVAVVAGTPYTSKYTNITVTGHVEVNGMAYVGGVGGKNAYANWTNITVNVDSTSYVKANSTENGTNYRTYVGGVIGFNGEGNHLFKDITSNIKVIGNIRDIGGIFGIAHYDNRFENITFNGSVEAPEGAKEVGGIAGVWHNQANTTVTFTNCDSNGSVTVGETTVTGSVVGGAYSASNVAPSVSGSLMIDGVESWCGVAKIGDTFYYTLADALAAVGSGDVVIELIADATLDYTAREAYGLTETNSLTINGNGFTLTLNQKNSDWASIGLKNADAKLVLNNMTVEKVGYGDTNGAWNTHAIIFTCALEMNNMTVNQSMAVQKGATLNNVNINEANGFYGLWIYANGQSVVMNGGSITATNGGRGIKVADEYVNENTACVTLNINNVVFNTAKKAAVLVTSPKGAVITAENLNISGVAADSENIVWVDEKYSAQYNNVTVNGELAAIEGGAEAYEAYVLINGEHRYYKSFTDAIKAANGTTLTLLGHAVLNKTAVVDSNVAVVIDLNGYIITYAPSETKASAVIQNNGSLTIQDSVGGGKITTKALNPDTNWGGDGQLAFPSYANNTIANHGTLVLESGTIENTSAAGGATYAIDNYKGSITINGGLVYCENNIAIRFFANNTNAEITVTGGEIEGTRAIWIQLPSSNPAIAPTVTVNVTGGTLSGRVKGDYYLAIYSYNYGNDPKNVSLNISGGTFNGDIALTGGANKSSVEKLTITGGTFNGNIYTYGSEDIAQNNIKISDGVFTDGSVGKYCEDGLKLVENVATGTYSVIEVQDATPVIGANGNWWIGGADTGLSAGYIDRTPHVGANGNWWIGERDLQIPHTHTIENGTCSLCGEACTHVNKTIVTIVPTCTVAGSTTVTCNDCGATVSTTVIDATGHLNTTTTTVDATCTTAGSITVTCNDCGAIVSTTVIDATGHLHTTATTANPTCTTEGSITVTCDDCGALVSTTVLAATGHLNTTTTTVDATCTEAGSITVTCDACGATVSTTVIDAKGHTEEVIPAVNATCTEVGLTEGKKCSVCGEILVAQQTVPATGHVNTTTTTVDATCTEAGSITVTCDDCGATVSEEAIAATGHDTTTTKVDATCTKDGSITVTCKVCGATVSTETIKATGHTYVDGTCKCGAKDPNYVPPHEHNFVEGSCECGEEDPNYVAPTEPGEDKGIDKTYIIIAAAAAALILVIVIVCIVKSKSGLSLKYFGY